VIRCTEALERMLVSRGSLLSFRNALLISVCEDCLGGDAIHANSVGPNLCGNILSQDLDSGLGRGIRYGRVRMRLATGGRGNRDDAAGLSLLHSRQNALDR